MPRKTWHHQRAVGTEVLDQCVNQTERRNLQVSESAEGRVRVNDLARVMPSSVDQHSQSDVRSSPIALDNRFDARA